VTSYEEYEPEEPRGWSPLAVALIATLVLLLGLGGALFGIDVADRNKKAAGTLPETVSSAPATTAPTSAAPTPSGSASPTPPASPTPDGASAAPFALPVLTGLDFQAARTKVRDLKLGWSLTFDGVNGGDLDLTVKSTDPAANAMVKRGDSVAIVVRGLAPLATVPNVGGLSCDQAAAQIVDKGLYPTYPTGRTGQVQSQSPAPADPSTLHWNDHVTITCG
jgi:PASTA domain